MQVAILYNEYYEFEKNMEYAMTTDGSDSFSYKHVCTEEMRKEPDDAMSF